MLILSINWNKMNLKKKTMTVLFLILVTLGASAFVYSQDWPMIGHNPGNTGYSPSSGPSVGNLQWEYQTGDEVTTPVVADGKVYIGGISIEGSKIYCLNAETGASIWNYSTPTLYWSSPAVADNKVYIGLFEKILCLNADWGVLIWETNFPGAGQITTPAVADGKVTVGGTNGQIYRLDADTGDLEWNLEIELSGPVYSAPAVAEGKIYVVFGGGGIICLNTLSPTSNWARPVESNVMLSPAVADGKVYISSDNSKVNCLDAYTGSPIWESDCGGIVTSSPTVADGEVYIGLEYGRVYCLDAYTGAWIWEYQTGHDVTSTVVADGKVYICSDRLYCLNTDTGAWIWDYFIGDYVTSPAVADEKVYISSYSGTVYCIGSTLDERIASLEAENAALRSDLDALNARVSETEINFTELPGVRLNLLSQGEYTISAEETTNVWHGFMSRPWNEYTEEQKTEFLSTAQWRFTVDGEEVPLDHVLRLQDGSMWSVYYRVFPPGYFKVGSHRLVGEWHSMEDRRWDSYKREAKLRVK